MTIEEMKVMCYLISDEPVTNNISKDTPEEEWGCSVWGGVPESKSEGRLFRSSLNSIRKELSSYGIKCSKTKDNDGDGVYFDVDWKDNKKRKLEYPLDELFSKHDIERALKCDNYL